MKSFQQKILEYVDLHKWLGNSFIEAKISLEANNLFITENQKYVTSIYGIPAIIDAGMRGIKVAFKYRDKYGILSGELLDSRFKVPGVD